MLSSKDTCAQFKVSHAYLKVNWKPGIWVYLVLTLSSMAAHLGTYSIDTEQYGSIQSKLHFAVNIIRSFDDNYVIFKFFIIILENTHTFYCAL